MDKKQNLNSLLNGIIGLSYLQNDQEESKDLLLLQEAIDQCIILLDLRYGDFFWQNDNKEKLVEILLFLNDLVDLCCVFTNVESMAMVREELGVLRNANCIKLHSEYFIENIVSDTVVL